MLNNLCSQLYTNSEEDESSTYFEIILKPEKVPLVRESSITKISKVNMVHCEYFQIN